MENQLSEREVRIAKVAKMKSMGVVPYAQSFAKKDCIVDIIKTYQDRELRDITDIISSPVHQVSTAGRVMLYRSHWKLAFAKLLDSTDQIQLMFHRDNCSLLLWDQSLSHLADATPEWMTAYKFMEKMVDVGDFIGVQWEVFKTHKGETTIFVSAFSFLVKGN
jgi:lysyl-tRNA synthetase, class II